jgi:hypothetical protein
MPLIPTAFEECLVEYLLLMERKYFAYTRDGITSPAFHLAVQNKIHIPFSIAKESAEKDWFKRCMKGQRVKPSLLQPTELSTARPTGFSKKQVRILFDLYEKGLVAHEYPTSFFST